MVIVGSNEAESSNSKRRRTGESYNSREEEQEEDHQEEEQEEDHQVEEQEEEHQEEEQEEEDDDDDDEEEEEEIIWGSIDKDFLHCSICLEPLRPPLMHCLNGHAGCSSCWEKLGNKCPICKLTCVVRSISLENLVESFKIPCKYKKLGCDELIPYHNNQEHLEDCPFGPLSCPIPTCPCKVFAGKLYQHFAKDHKFPRIDFPFNSLFTFNLEQSDGYVILLGPNRTPFLLVNQPVDKGHAISLHHINPLTEDEQSDGSLEISAARTRSENGKALYECEKERIKIETKVGSIEGDEIVGRCVVVPAQFACMGRFELSVLVRTEE